MADHADPLLRDRLGSSGRFRCAVSDRRGQRLQHLECRAHRVGVYQFGGFTRNLPGEDDGRNTLGFLNEPELIASSPQRATWWTTGTGELVEADIFFNCGIPWSVASAGERNRWDLESIALHEIGHLNGLGHSAIGETELLSGGGRRVLSTGSVMFPIALGTGDISGRRLTADDIAGVSDLYPDNGFNDTTGSVSGRITKSGVGVNGAHIVAFDSTVGRDGRQLQPRRDRAVLDRGSETWTARPARGTARRCRHREFLRPRRSDGRQLPRRVHERMVIVPKGGDSGAVEVKVVPK